MVESNVASLRINDDDDLLLSPDQADDFQMSWKDRSNVIEPSTLRFPTCIVWSPIPILTWFLPFIGHMGLADSKGTIFDFAGPYTINRDNFTFGTATRYLQCIVEPENADKWDEAIAVGCKIYEKRMHNLCCDNCHSHVAVCLEQMNYAGRKRWNMVELCWWMFFCGKYVSVAGFIKSWLPFIVVLALITIVRSSA